MLQLCYSKSSYYYITYRLIDDPSLIYTITVASIFRMFSVPE